MLNGFGPAQVPISAHGMQVLYPLRPCMRIALSEKELQAILSSAQEAMCDAARETLRRNEQKQEAALQDFLVRTGKVNTDV